MRRVPIRMKLVAALVVPLVGLLVVTWLEVRAISSEVDDVRAQTDLVETSLGPLSITTALQLERAAASLYIIGQEENFSIQVEDNAEARGLVDAAVEDFTATMEERGGRLAEVYAPAMDALDAIQPAREAVDATEDARRNLGNTAASKESFDRYS
jgi:Nitrate and nitrite sensing